MEAARERVITVGLCIICHDRPGELQTALQSGQRQGFDEIVVVDMASDPPLARPPGVRFVRINENLGVAAGRNLAAQSATADVLAFLDDDATFASNGVVSELRERFSRDRRLAAVAMRIERPGGKILSHEFPFRGKGDPTRQGGPCAYFVGAGFAIRRTEYLAIGGFDARFFYSTEEIDLAFGLIRRGGILEYVPELVVVHSPSSRGRGHSGELPALRLRNRIWLARRHLPWLVAIVHISLWSARTLVEAIRAAAITGWLRALLIGLTTDEHRTPVTISTAIRVHRLGGRSFW